MVIIALADIHGSLSHLPEIAGELSKADLILIAGDITTFGDWAAAKEIVDHIRRCNSNVLAVVGNCDRPEVNDFLTSEGINLDSNCVNVGGVWFMGLGGSLPCHGDTSNEMLDEDFDIHLTALEAQIPLDGHLVLVTHEPAADTVVDISGGEHIGSHAVRDFIEENQPVLAISGHTHEAVGIGHIGQTMLINPGVFRHGQYACIELDQKGIRVDLRTAPMP